MEKRRKYEVYGLYCVCDECADNDGKIRYVGQTVEGAQARFVKHKHSARRKQPWAVSRWIMKHGEDNIRVAVLRVCESPEELDEVEEQLIREYRTLFTEGGYNIQPGGNGASGYTHAPDALSRRKGQRHSDETRAKISAAVRGRYGEASSNHSITQKQAEEIVRLLWSGMTVKEVASQTGVKVTTVTGISNGDAWTKVPRPTSKRKIIKTGRFEKGGVPTTTKLNPDKVRDIRARLDAGEDRKVIAADYNVTPENISMIRYRKTWKHVV